MKPFNLEEARAGKKVCTKTGLSARIIRFDVELDAYKERGIVSLITKIDGSQHPLLYTNFGQCITDASRDFDLMMVSEKKKGWINIYKNFSGEYYGGGVFEFKEQADNCSSQRIDCAEIEWEE